MNRLVVVAGSIITLCGIGHSAGALIQAASRYADAWLDGALWRSPNDDLAQMTPVTAAFWFTVYSFGIPLLMIGATVLWCGFRGIVPSRGLAWSLAAWVAVGTAASGLSPLVLLFVSSGLMLAAAGRARADARAAADHVPA